mmetsp:Transcript_115960/g.368823  ORF Transcript_115960/g.368823 Transcript_115960/m.368823 type:complete len:570 (+) Transcript_115960:43-1752(+)
MEALSPLELQGVEQPLFNLDLHDVNKLDNLRSYYGLCSKSTDLFVTTSCFAAWKKEKCTNGCAKLIPAVPAEAPLEGGGEKCCVFFFDDNINLHLGAGAGAPETKGICNLRDINTGEYVDFSEGNNGFKLEREHRHTLIHHSSKYRTVLIQANILEAMSNDDYFTSIIDKYSQEGEKLIVYMDVNGTILWSDSIMGLGARELLLEAMLGLAEVYPHEPFEIQWEEQPEVKLSAKTVMKQLMHDISDGDKSIFHLFLTLEKTCVLLRRVLLNAKLTWANGGEFTIEDFVVAYEGYVLQLRKQETGREHHGITTSWFRCLKQLQDGGHTAVINSFGMDTQKVVVRSAEEAHSVMHVAVNFEMWSERDASKYAAQFKDADDSLSPKATHKDAMGWPSASPTRPYEKLLPGPSDPPATSSGSVRAFAASARAGAPSGAVPLLLAPPGAGARGSSGPSSKEEVLTSGGAAGASSSSTAAGKPSGCLPCTKRPPPESAGPEGRTSTEEERGAKRPPADEKEAAQELKFKPPRRPSPAVSGAREVEQQFRSIEVGTSEKNDRSSLMAAAVLFGSKA